MDLPLPGRDRDDSGDRAVMVEHDYLVPALDGSAMFRQMVREVVDTDVLLHGQI